MVAIQHEVCLAYLIDLDRRHAFERGDCGLDSAQRTTSFSLRGRKLRVKSVARPTLPTIAPKGISRSWRRGLTMARSLRRTSSNANRLSDRPVSRAIRSCIAARWRARRKSRAAPLIAKSRPATLASYEKGKGLSRRCGRAQNLTHIVVSKLAHMILRFYVFAQLGLLPAAAPFQ